MALATTATIRNMFSGEDYRLLIPPLADVSEHPSIINAMSSQMSLTKVHHVSRCIFMVLYPREPICELVVFCTRTPPPETLRWKDWNVDGIYVPSSLVPEVQQALKNPGDLSILVNSLALVIILQTHQTSLPDANRDYWRIRSIQEEEGEEAFSTDCQIKIGGDNLGRIMNPGNYSRITYGIVHPHLAPAVWV